MKNSSGKLSLRRLCVLGLLTAVLFVQEAALSFLPNVQLTFLLVLLYGACLGVKYGSLVVTAHVLLDNMIFGSLVAYVVVPMWLGWELTLLTGAILRRSSEGWLALFGAINSVVYSLLFAVAMAVLSLRRDMGFAWGAYLLADLPFTAVMVASTVISVLFLYAPLARLLSGRLAELFPTSRKLQAVLQGKQKEKNKN